MEDLNTIDEGTELEHNMPLCENILNEEDCDEKNGEMIDEEDCEMIDAEECDEPEMEINLQDNSEAVKAPECGMTFNSLDELVELYKKYGKQEGFGIRRDSLCYLAGRKSKLVTLACSRARKPHSTKRNLLNPNPATKTNCKARVNANVSMDGSCRVTSVVLEHNHGLSPTKSRFYLCNRQINRRTQRQLELSDQAGIRVMKNFNYFVVEAGGHENVPFLEKDCRNYIEKARRLRLGVGDAEAILAYFDKMQKKNSDFYHLMKFDDDNRIKHIFWADARSRAAYEEFSDVITFDTTYLTNKYDMPFAVFVGVNHHGQSTLLGCALISNEDVQTFIWLFSSWLSCMSGKPPDAIITDQDKAMKKAIQIMFPNCRHRWCLWHIMKKIPEKLSSHSMYRQMRIALENIVYDCLTVEDFEESWAKFIVQFNLENNTWLSGLYEERHRWVPAFVKDSFWARMSTTQRSEGINAFFDKYVNSKTTLKQFVEQYENALRSKVEKETQADFDSFNSCFPCVTHFEIEKQFQEVYTNAKFKELQVEMISKLYCKVSFVKEEVGLWEYVVCEDVLIGENGKRKKMNYKVHFNELNCEVQCGCRLFEFRGILCRHAISVLIEKDVAYVKAKYILPRWRKDVRRHHTRVKVGYNDLSNNPEVRRFDGLYKHFDEVIDLAVESDLLSKYAS